MKSLLDMHVIEIENTRDIEGNSDLGCFITLTVRMISDRRNLKSVSRANDLQTHWILREGESPFFLPAIYQDSYQLNEIIYCIKGARKRRVCQHQQEKTGVPNWYIGTC